MKAINDKVIQYAKNNIALRPNEKAVLKAYWRQGLQELRNSFYQIPALPPMSITASGVKPRQGRSDRNELRNLETCLSRNKTSSDSSWSKNRDVTRRWKNDHSSKRRAPRSSGLDRLFHTEPAYHSSLRGRRESLVRRHLPCGDGRTAIVLRALPSAT